MRRMGDLTDLSEKLLRYKFNLSYAYSFFAFGSVFVGGFLILVATGLVKIPAIIVSCLIIFAIVGVIILRLVFIDTHMKMESQRLEGLLWGLSFAVPFVLVFIAWGALDLPNILMTSGFLWYIALGISSVLVAILVENWYISSNILNSRPFLLAGLLICLTSPLLPLLNDIVSSPADEYSGQPLGMGLVLVIFLTSGTVAILRAEKIFKRADQ